MEKSDNEGALVEKLALVKLVGEREMAAQRWSSEFKTYRRYDSRRTQARRERTGRERGPKDEKLEG